MNAEEIKQEIKKQGYSLATFAEKIEVGYTTLRLALSGKQPLTASLKNHIMLALREPSEVLLVYRVKLPEAACTELLGDKCSADKEARPAALEAVIRHNLTELAERGAALNWSDDERRALGLDKPGAVAKMLARSSVVISE